MQRRRSGSDTSASADPSPVKTAPETQGAVSTAEVLEPPPPQPPPVFVPEAEETGDTRTVVQTSQQLAEMAHPSGQIQPPSKSEGTPTQREALEPVRRVSISSQSSGTSERRTQHSQRKDKAGNDSKDGHLASERSKSSSEWQRDAQNKSASE